MSEQKTIRYGIMCNGTVFKQWQANCLQYLFADKRFELSLLIVDGTNYAAQSTKQKLNKYLLYNQYENRILRPKSRQRTFLHSELSGIPQLRCKVKARGKYSQTFADTDVEKIKDFNLDFVIRFGFNILKGEILNCANWGIWSYHHGDPEEFRGGPAGLWEILKKKNSTGAILQRLTEKLDQGVILHKGSFPTVKHSFSEQIDGLLYGSASWVKTAALNCMLGNVDPEKGIHILNTVGPVYKRPTTVHFIRFQARLVSNRLHFYWCKYFYREMWQTGITNMPTSELLTHPTLTAGSWLPEQGTKDCYYADPFVSETSRGLQLFLERFDYKKKKADIVSTDFINGEFSPLKKTLETAHHLSYPFVFEEGGNRFLLPECWQSGKLTLYKISGDEVVPVCDLLSNFKAVDPTIVKHNGMYWLFCTEKKAPSHQLHLFYAEKLEGPFTPHQLNPVKTSITDARPAGNCFYVDGELYRPAQNCSATYGGSVTINKIVELSTNAYKEVVVNEICPDKSWKHNRGLHTISVVNDWIVFDAKLEQFHFNSKGN